MRKKEVILESLHILNTIAEEAEHRESIRDEQTIVKCQFLLQQ